MNEEKKTRWVRCPECDKKTRIKVQEDTVLIKFPLHCQKCKKTTLVNVINFRIEKSLEPGT